MLRNIGVDLAQLTPISVVIYMRLSRAKSRTGKSVVWIKDKEENPITVEIRKVK